MKQVKYTLDEKQIPTEWYNIQADLPKPLPPVLHPGTKEPIGPQDLAPLFPMELIKQEVDARVTDTTVEVLFKNRRVASHLRSYQEGGFTTLPEHMPKSHQKYLDWTPSRIIKWAGENGPKTQRLVTHILDSRPHPEQGFRSCLGIMRLAKHYSPERLEAACARAILIKAYSYKSVNSIPKNGLDQQPLLFDQTETTAPVTHGNIRGKYYYQGGL